MTDTDEGKGRDAQLALSELRRELAQLPPKKRMDALLEGAHARAVVRSLPAEDLYFTIAEVGLADATELVQLAAPSQFRTFVDLGAWEKDRVEPHQLLTWLRAARGDEPEEFLRKVKAVDLEVIELLLRAFTTVHDLEENPDVNPPGVTMETPEGRYLIEFSVEGAELAALRSLVNDFIAENPFEAIRLFEAVRWELPSELEESAYRFRSARLEDLGFPTLEEAVRLFTFVDPKRGSAPPAPGQALAPSKGHVDYLEAAARNLTLTEQINLEDELRQLANAALVAEAADPGDLDSIRRVAERARDCLSLGLEHLTGGDPSRAADLVHEMPLRRIFQIGFSLTLQLKFRAERLVKQPLARIERQLLLFPEEAVALEALLKKRPERALKVPGAEPVAFRSLREVMLSEAVLERAEAQVALLSGLLGGTADRAREVLARFGVALPVLGVDRFFAATVGMAVLEGRVEPRPIPGGRTSELAERLFEGDARGPKLRSGVEDRVAGVLSEAAPASAHPELRRLVHTTLARLLEELAVPYLQEGRLDPTASVLLPMESPAAP